MPVLLEIPDGDPWWQSPNVWPAREGEVDLLEPVVAEEPTSLWARVRNDGDEEAVGATLRFFLADPALLIDRRSATVIAVTRFTVPAGATAAVVLPEPWFPPSSAAGPRVLLAEAFHRTDDPVAPGIAFDVPDNRQVAQRPLEIVRPARGPAARPGAPTAA